MLLNIIEKDKNAKYLIKFLTCIKGCDCFYYAVFTKKLYKELELNVKKCINYNYILKKDLEYTKIEEDLGYNCDEFEKSIK